MVRPPSDLRHLILLLLVCAAASALGDRLRDDGPALQVVVEEPAAHTTLQGWVRVAGWLADWRPDGGFAPDSVGVYVDAPEPALLGRPRLRVPRAGNGARAAFDLGWETCTFRPGPYTLRVAARSYDGTPFGESVAITVGPCAAGPDGVLRRDALDGPSSAWPPGTTACVTADYVDDAYRLVHRLAAEGACGVWDGAHTIYGDFALAVDAVVPGAAQGDAAVVAFRAAPSGTAGGEQGGLTGYGVVVEPAAGRVGLWRYNGAEPPRLLEQGDVAESPAARYAIEVRADGPELAVWIGGRRVLAAQDHGAEWGRLYLAAAGTGATRAEARFRQLTLRRVPLEGTSLARYLPEPALAALLAVPPLAPWRAAEEAAWRSPPRADARQVW